MVQRAAGLEVRGPYLQESVIFLSPAECVRSSNTRALSTSFGRSVHRNRPSA